MATGRQSVAKEGLQVRASELEVEPLIMSRDSKPFNPEEVRVIITSLQQPAVFLNMVSDWPALKWNVEHLSRLLNGKPLKFRIGERKMTKVPQFETHCEYIQATLQEFLDWLHDESDDSTGQFAAFPRSRYWGYCDYKYVAMIFKEKAEVFQDVIWSDFGFPGRDGRDSTLWIGTEGANTPCHLDSYGCNLVLQVQGRKRWHLFPPEDTASLYPTRIPYEESSVFSSVNVVNPDLEHFPRFHGAKPHVVTLHPGEDTQNPEAADLFVEAVEDMNKRKSNIYKTSTIKCQPQHTRMRNHYSVLFVPRHWWHYVESLDPVTVSINSWIELDDDDETRVGEALARTVVCALKAADPHVHTASWLNTTEAEVTSLETNLHYVNLAVQACIDKRKVCSSTGRNLSARSLSTFKRRKCDSGDGAGYSAVADADPKPALTTSIPFGPNLLPVVQDTGATAKHRVPSDSSKANISLSSKLEANNCSGKVGSNSKNIGVHSTTISTDELLNCLVHPDVISLMTEILLDSHFSH